MSVLIIRERFPFSGVTMLGFCHRTPGVAGGPKMNDKLQYKVLDRDGLGVEGQCAVLP